MSVTDREVEADIKVTRLMLNAGSAVYLQYLVDTKRGDMLVDLDGLALAYRAMCARAPKPPEVSGVEAPHGVKPTIYRVTMHRRKDDLGGTDLGHYRKTDIVDNNDNSIPSPIKPWYPRMAVPGAQIPDDDPRCGVDRRVNQRATFDIGDSRLHSRRQGAER